MDCPICNVKINEYGTAEYYDSAAKYRTPVFRCKDCNILCRDVSQAKLLEHLNAASYVKLDNEPKFFTGRKVFFKYVLALAKRYFCQNITDTDQLNILDFGSSYGHLLEIAQQEGFGVSGVEVNDILRSKCRQKGLDVYGKLAEIQNKVDVITMIDSLYYVLNCRDIMKQLSDTLKPGGGIIVRVTNRNLYASFMKNILRKNDLSGIGDACISYSVKGIKRLLESAGFQILKIIPDWGRGKNLSFKTRVYYLAGFLLTVITFNKIIFTPGFIVVANRKEQCT